MKSLIIIGPSGVGKGTVISQLLRKYSIFQFVISFTTRKPRPGEINGKDYLFISHEEFKSRQKNGQMLQSKKVFTNFYGTSRQSYFNILKKSKIPLLDIDIEGMLDIKSKIKSQQGELQQPEVLCIMPPSWSILQERLSKRGTQKQEILQQRMQENQDQVNKMMKLRDQGIHFVTNYQYQLTVFGTEIFLASKFPQFRNLFWINRKSKQIIQ